MFDFFDIDENFTQTPTLVLWSVILYLFVYYRYKKEILRNYAKFDSESNYLGTFFWILLFALTCFCNGDFFNAITHIINITSYAKINELNHFELVYQYIAAFFGGHYLLWRLTVWGSAILLIALTAKRLGVNPKTALFVMFALFAVQYSYARSTLAQSIFFWGLSYVIKPIKKMPHFVSYVVGFGIILLSTYFHRSMWALVALSPICFTPRVFTGTGYKRLIIAFLGLSIIAAVVSSLIYTLDIGSLLKDDSISEHLEYYAERQKGGGGVSGFLLDFIKYLKNIGIAFILAKCLSKIDSNEIPQSLDAFYKFFLALMVISYTLSFMGDTFWTLSYRTLIMAFIPCTISVSLASQNSLLKVKSLKIVLILGFLHSFFTIFYAYYCSIVNQ